MSEHEQQAEPEQFDGIEDLEPSAEQAEQVAGGATSFSDITITKTTDTSSPKLYP